MRDLDCRVALRAGECGFGRSAATAADARGNYHLVCASRGEGRTECGDSLYYSNSVAAGVGVF